MQNYVASIYFNFNGFSNINQNSYAILFDAVLPCVKLSRLKIKLNLKIDLKTQIQNRLSNRMYR